MQSAFISLYEDYRLMCWHNITSHRKVMFWRICCLHLQYVTLQMELALSFWNAVIFLTSLKDSNLQLSLGKLHLAHKIAGDATKVHPASVLVLSQVGFQYFKCTLSLINTKCTFRSSGLWHCVNGLVFPDVLKVCSTECQVTLTNDTVSQTRRPDTSTEPLWKPQILLRKPNDSAIKKGTYIHTYIDTWVQRTITLVVHVMVTG
jgi:hypothetical protein